MRRPDGRYVAHPQAELEELLEDYAFDEWDEITAAETPKAREAERPQKRSGTYVREDLEKMAEVVEAKRQCYK